MNKVSKFSNHAVNVQRRYKMYKAGKRWLFAGIFFVGSVVGVMSGSNVVAAATAVQSQAQVAVNTDSRDGARAEAGNYTKSAATTDYTNDDSTAINATQPAKSDATATSEGQGQQNTSSDATSAVPVDQSKDSDARQSSNVNEPTTTAAKSEDTPQLHSAAAVHITKDNLQDYFNVNGSASYDQATGVITLTTNDGNETGNVTLKNKIDLNESFDLKGSINLGDKSQLQGGGDGISFGFHSGNTDEVGKPGAGLGISGLNDAIGWKADTVLNWTTTFDATADPTDQFSVPTNDGQTYGGDKGLSFGGGHAYGAFFNTDATGLVNTVIGKDATDTARAKEIAEPALNAFHDIEVAYDGHAKTLTVTYDGQTWQQNISQWADTKSDAALIIAAATECDRNLQQFKFASCDYYTTPTVDVIYRDLTKGVILGHDTAEYPGGELIGQHYITNVHQFDRYEYVGLGEGSLPESGVLTQPGNNGTVIYTYRENANGKQNATVSYFDETTHTILNADELEGEKGELASYSDKTHIQSYQDAGYVVVSDPVSHGFTFDNIDGNHQAFVVRLAHGISFDNTLQSITRTIHYVSGKNVTTELSKPHVETATFTRTDATDLVTHKTSEGAWSAVQTFDEVVSPIIRQTVDGQTVTYAADQANVAALKVDLNQATPTTAQLNITVNYYPVGLGDGIQVRIAVDEPALPAPADNPGDGIPNDVETPTDTPVNTTTTPSLPNNGEPDLPNTFDGDDQPDLPAIGGYLPPNSFDFDSGKTQSLAQNATRRGNTLIAMGNESNQGDTNSTVETSANGIAAQLPQTGNTHNTVVSVIGVGLTAVMSLLGLGGLRKRN